MVMMRKPKLRIGILLVLICLSLSSVTAQPSDSEVVVLSNSDNAVMAESIANKLDTVVLRVENDHVPRPTLRAMNRMNPDKVIIVGSERDVSLKVQNKLERSYSNVERINQGNEIDNSIHISNEYWPEGSKEATIVQKGSDSPVISASIRNRVKGSEGPIIMARSGSLGNVVLEEVRRLGTEQVTVYTHGSHDVGKELRESGVETVKTVNKESMDPNYDQKIDHDTLYVVVMPSDSSEGLNAIASGKNTEGAVIRNRADINRVVGLTQESNVRKVVVVGDSPLARSALVAFRTGSNVPVEKEYESSSATARIALN